MRGFTRKMRYLSTQPSQITHAGARALRRPTPTQPQPKEAAMVNPAQFAFPRIDDARFTNSSDAVFTLYDRIEAYPDVPFKGAGDEEIVQLPSPWPDRRLRFTNKALRDRTFFEWRDLGWQARRSSTQHAVIDAHYVWDLDVEDEGVANEQYAGPLYSLEVVANSQQGA